MTVQWSRELLERHVATGIYDFDRADIPDLSETKTSAGKWISRHFRSSSFRAQYREPVREQAFNIIYRAQNALRSYEDARIITIEYLSRSSIGRPAISAYFAALAQWEMCFLNWQALVGVYNRLSDQRAFTKGDGSKDELAYEIANDIKHSAGAAPAGDVVTVPMWLTNVGFSTRLHNLAYVELAQLMREAGSFAEELIIPGASPSAAEASDLAA